MREKRVPGSISKNRRSILKGALVAAAAPALIGPALAQQKVSWKVQAHWPKASGSFNDSLGALAKELAARCASLGR